MIVEITSCAPRYAFRKPAIAAQAEPISAAPSVARTTASRPWPCQWSVTYSADLDGEVGADPVLALAADVEEAAAEREADREAREHERRRVGQRVRQVDLGDHRIDVHRVPGEVLERPVEAGADRELLVHRERVRADEDHDEPAEHERDHDRDEREERAAQPLPHDAASAPARRLPPVIARPSSLSFVWSGRVSSVTCALVHHEDAVGQPEDLVELERDQQHRASGVALLDQLAVHELDRADVEAARRLRGQQQLRLQIDLAREHELLLVAAGEGARRRRGRAAAHVEALDQAAARG